MCVPCSVRAGDVLFEEAHLGSTAFSFKKAIQCVDIFNTFVLNANKVEMKQNHINRLVVLVDQGKTGKWLAEQLGKAPSTVSLWRSNKIQPSLNSLTL